MKIGNIVFIVNNGQQVEKHVIIECDEKGEPVKSVRLDEGVPERPYDKAYDKIDNISSYYYFKTKKEAYAHIKKLLIAEKETQTSFMEQKIAKLEQDIASLE